ncbi:hypothetical protein, partial [Kitasatospora sp. NPDC059817]|uniref:hypothetical protein n=1 Tax=Kitasatospora sp. NPDC059817 TaxID=3346961 RepID=UPI003664BABC
MTRRTHRSGAAPLGELAEKRMPPDHQVMDQPTLNRIAGMRPEVFAAPPTLPHSPLMSVPDVTWYYQSPNCENAPEGGGGGGAR